MLPNQKPWRVWYSADGCLTWRSSKASFGSSSRAVHQAVESVGPRILSKLNVPMLALCAIHSGTLARSPVHYLRPEDVIGVEQPVVVQLYHGRCRPMTMAFGWALAHEIERRQKTSFGPLTLRRHFAIAPILSIDDAARGAPGRVMSEMVEATVLRGMSIYKIQVCTEDAMNQWQAREKLARVRDAIDKLDCSAAERTELVEMLYQEDLGTRLDTETPEQIASERLKWLREQIDG